MKSSSYFVRLGLPEGTEIPAREALSRILTGVASRFSFQGLEDWSVDLPDSTKILGAEREFHDLTKVSALNREMRVYFAKKADAANFGRLLKANFEDLTIFPPRKLAPKDWMKEWRKHYRTQKISGGHREIFIVPAWKKSPKGKVSVRVYPGQAFGTGTHPTTRLCLQAFLEQELPASANILDFGAGTGVLALGALAQGSVEKKKFKATAVESDPEALDQCRKNARLNRLPMVFSLRLPRKKFDFVFANVLAPVLVKFRGPLISSLKKGGVIVLSGILASDGKNFLRQFQAKGLQLREEKHEGDWVAFVFESV